jgi:multiple sugar transport system permease protein
MSESMSDPHTRAARANLRGLGFIAPNLALFLVFSLGPALFTLGLAFFRWDPFSRPEFVGFSNFSRLFCDAQFWYYLFNTLVFMIGLPISMAGSLGLALLLSRRLRGTTFYRTLFYLPTITNGVALYLLWKVMFTKEGGMINGMVLPVLQWLGVSAGVDHHLITSADMPDWLQSPLALPGWWVALWHAVLPQSWWFLVPREIFYAKPALIVMGIWSAVGGGNMLLYLSALAGVPGELYEAAAMDGAGPWRRFRDITWKMVAPTTFFIAVMGVIGGLQGGFEMAYLMTQGGPDGSTTTVGYYIFIKAFHDFEFGYAAAISFVIFALTALVTWANWRRGQNAADGDAD